MKLAVLTVIALTALATDAAAQAAPDARTLGYLEVEPPPPDPAAAGGGVPSRVLYLNNCWTTSCAIMPGNFQASDNSRTNLSSIVRPVAGDNFPYSPRNLTPYTGTPATWDAIVACVRENYAPYNIEIVTTEPPANTSYYEAFAAGLPGELGFGSTTGGVASSATNCSVIPNAISFSFLNASPNDVFKACWFISQESAHNFGLSHEMLAGDAMTYIVSPARKRFLNETACIGTAGCCQPQGECRCGNVEQNSHQRLEDIFGAGDATPPTVVIETPIDDELVQPGFVVRAVVTDNVAVAQVELLIDGVVTRMLTTGPYAFNAPATITTGPHTIAIRGTDNLGDQTTVTIDVNVAGSGSLGGLGEICDADHPCVSGMCATKGGDSRCSELCDPNASGCGDGFSCLDNPAGGGLCWPEEAGCGGCGTDGGASPVVPIGAGLMLSALLLRRRRREP